MIDEEVALSALSTLCNANVTSVQTQSSQHGGATARAAAHQQLFISNFIPTILHAEETSNVSRSSFVRLQSICQGVDLSGGAVKVDTPSGMFQINKDEFFDPQFNCDFTKLRDTKTYHRGGEVYERPCGWQRFALKVLDKYGENTWLGNSYRSTQSVPGEWPVSYHGTSQQFAQGIVEGFYQAGPRERFGRGIYSTPYIAEAIHYAKTFTHKDQRYKVILQNRINPKKRQKHNNDKYWLVSIPHGTSPEEEKKIVQDAIRPYGLLLRKI